MKCTSSGASLSASQCAEACSAALELQQQQAVRSSGGCPACLPASQPGNERRPGRNTGRTRRSTQQPTQQPATAMLLLPLSLVGQRAACTYSGTENGRGKTPIHTRPACARPSIARRVVGPCMAAIHAVGVAAASAGASLCSRRGETCAATALRHFPLASLSQPPLRFCHHRPLRTTRSHLASLAGAAHSSNNSLRPGRL